MPLSLSPIFNRLNQLNRQWLGAGLLLILGGLHFLLRLDIQCNDDTYIYFNYARTFLEGNPFCYDSRGIPSEGFTSILFLLLLLPFEALGINMMFAAVLLNCLAIGLTIWLAGRIFRGWEWSREKGAEKREEIKLRSTGSSHWKVPAFMVVFGVLLLAWEDKTALVTGRALETMLGVAAVFWGVERFVFVLKEKNKVTGKGIGSFMVAAGVLYLIRPELLPGMALLGLLLLIYHPRRKHLLIAGSLFALGILLYHLAKAVYFGDPFPTAYYRKITSEQVTGYMYVRGFVLEYLWHFLMLGGIVVGTEAWSWWKNKRSLWFQSPIPLAIALMGGYNIAFYYYVMPLVEYGFRHFMPAIGLMYLGMCMGIFFHHCDGFKPVAMMKKYILPALLLGVSIYQNPLPKNPSLNLYQKAHTSTKDFYYLKLGRFIHDELPSHRDLTMVFGDAGALPYEARCRFVDLNGLSEPYIARLFQWEDDGVKAIKYAEYILSQHPDIIVLAGDTTIGGRLPHAISMHDPFRHNLHWGHYDSHKLEAFEQFRQAGFGYLFTATGYFYPLHFLVNKNSSYFTEISKTLPRFQEEVGGYILPMGLEVYNRRMAVCFERLEFFR